MKCSIPPCHLCRICLQIKESGGLSFAINQYFNLVFSRVIAAGGDGFDGMVFFEKNRFVRLEAEVFPLENFGFGFAVGFHEVNGVIDDHTLSVVYRGGDLGAYF